VGNVFDTSCSSSSPSCSGIDAGELASSVGVGLPWITALGPLSFSLAMPIVKPDDADTQVFQFSLGQTF
jgi:outer membrane protein insertion porin family